LSGDGGDKKAELRSALLQHWRGEHALHISDAAVAIPGFRGSDDAATRLLAEPAFLRANAVLISLDASLDAFRRRALGAGKVLVAAPLAPGGPYRVVEPAAIPLAHQERAADRDGFPRFARATPIDELPALDLVVLGAIAVDVAGGRLGDGGAQDLAYAALREAGKLSVKTPIATLVHPRQLVERPIPMSEGDVPVDFIFTPDSKVVTRTAHPRPAQPPR
jgi:5-formyltetrahydrofolate cyclo-ligase